MLQVFPKYFVWFGSNVFLWVADLLATTEGVQDKGGNTGNWQPIRRPLSENLKWTENAEVFPKDTSHKNK